MRADSDAQAPAAISVVVPVYRGAARLEDVCDRVTATAAAAGFDVEVILVDDASPDDTWKVITQLAAADPRVRGFRLGRNAGQHCATLCGLRAARHEVVVTLDDDLKHPPEAIPDLLAALHGDVDLVYGAPRDLAALGTRSVVGRVVKGAAGAMIGMRGAADATSFRAVRRRLIELLPDQIDRNLVVDVLFGWYTDTVEVVRVDATRPQTPSRYGFVDLARVLLDGSITYGAGRIRPLLVLGAGVSTAGATLALWRLRPGPRRPVGDRGVAQALLVSGTGLQLFGLAIVTEHVHRVQVRSAGQLPYWVRATTDDEPPG